MKSQTIYSIYGDRIHGQGEQPVRGHIGSHKLTNCRRKSPPAPLGGMECGRGVIPTYDVQRSSQYISIKTENEDHGPLVAEAMDRGKGKKARQEGCYGEEEE